MEKLLEYSMSPNLFEKYGLDVSNIIPKRGIFRIETDQGIQCLKKIKYDKKNLHFIHQAIEHLVQNGFEKVSRIRKTIDGSLFAEDGTDLYIMMNWIDGRECDYENPIDLDIAVKTLGELHNRSKGFEPDTHKGFRNVLGKWPQIFRERSNELKVMKEIVRAKEEKNRFDKMFLKYVDDYYQDSLEAIDGFEDFGYEKLVKKAWKEKSFCHNDYAYHNILISYDHQDVAVLDFDYCLLDLRINDLGSMIHRNLKKSNWDMKRAEYILKSYEKNNPLSEDEMKGLYIYLLFPTDFWRISNQYYIEKKDWDDEAFFNRMVEKAGCRELRKDFLKEFKKMTGM